jgi:hypothetical protein
LWENCFSGDHFFPLQLWGSFSVILYSLFLTSYMWMDGWMDGWIVVSPAEFFDLCGWMTMLVFEKLQVIQDARCGVAS